jgi:glutamate synthase (NADPH/NADH) small chain
MGKATGFMEYQRLQEASEAPQSRKKHYKEFVMHLDDAQAKTQAALHGLRHSVL